MYTISIPNSTLGNQFLTGDTNTKKNQAGQTLPAAAKSVSLKAHSTLAKKRSLLVANCHIRAYVISNDIETRFNAMFNGDNLN